MEAHRLLHLLRDFCAPVKTDKSAREKVGGKKQRKKVHHGKSLFGQGQVTQACGPNDREPDTRDGRLDLPKMHCLDDLVREP